MTKAEWQSLFEHNMNGEISIPINQKLYGTNTMRVGMNKKNIEIANAEIKKYLEKPENMRGSMDKYDYHRALKVKEAAENDLEKCKDDVWSICDNPPIYPFGVQRYPC